jgi:hypothetical protein
LGTAINGSNSPQWLKGMQLGQQLLQAGAPHPMMGMPGAPPQPGPQGMPGPMPGMGGQAGAVPGAIPQMPMGAGPPGMASGGMGMPGGGGVNPQLLAMLMRSRQM